jgi:biopolymer transport protein ExbD
MPWDEGEEEYDPLDEDEEAAEFTLTRGDPGHVEELDLAAMVDVAFQLVLFFLVTATTVLYKSLEIPRPNPESPAAGATQGKSHTLDDLKNDYILVEIDPDGAMKIDREPVASRMSALVERLRSAREATGRKAMLLSADSATPHRNAVLAYDAANEIGLGIAIARPKPRN